MSNNYMQPTPQFPVPPAGALTFTDFLQSVFVGISGLNGTFVRPQWQPAPPKQPDINVNWLAIGLTEVQADANAFIGSELVSSVITNVTQRMEKLTVRARFYGPQSYEYMGLTRDGFEIPFNRLALTQASMGFVDATKGMRVPDLVNERWCDTWVVDFTLRRMILRSYPILTFLSTSGSIQAELSGGSIKNIDWDLNL